MSGEVIKEGFLKKKGRINPAMQERKVILSGYTLKYYDFKKLKGEIDVRDAEVSVLNEQEFLFQIRATDRIYELQASTRKDLFEWVETLNRYIPTLPSTGRTAKESKREKLRSMFSSSGSRMDSQRNTSRFSTTRNRSPERRSSQRSTGRGAQSERQPSPPPSPAAKVDLQEKEEENPPSISDRSSQKSPRGVDSSSSSAASSSPPTTSESANNNIPTNRPPSSSSSSSQQLPSSSSPPSSSTSPSKVEEPSPAVRKSDPSPAARKVDPSPRRSVRRDPSNISMSTSPGGGTPSSSSSNSPSNPSPVVSSLTRQASSILSSSKEKEPTLNEKEDYIKKGKLKKKGEVNPIFKERTFVLRHNGQLEYYDEKLILKGSISLVDRSYLVTSVASFEWKLLPPGSEEKGREYVLRALSQDDMKEWLRALQISMEELALMKRKSIAGLNSLALPSSKAPGTAVLKEGIMFKKGESSATLWRERKFQLFADSIVYADLSGKLRGKIELTGYHRVVVMSQENCEFEIVPRDPKERHYSLRSKSKYDMDGWIAKINNVIEDLRAPPPEEPKKNEDTDEDVSDNEMEFEEATSSRRRRSGSPPPPSSKPSSSDSSQQASSPRSGDQAKKDNNNEGGAIKKGAAAEKKKEAPAKKETFALNELDEPAPSFDLNELDPDLASQADKPRPKTWVPDKKYKDCMICHVEFTFFNRKHHCRNCGKLLCDDCTPNFIRLPELGYVEPVRVCIACTDQHFKHAPKEQAGGGCLIS